MNLNLDFLDIDDVLEEDDIDLNDIEELPFEREFMGGHYYVVYVDGAEVGFGLAEKFKEVSFIGFSMNEHPRSIKLANNIVIKSGIANRIGAALVSESFAISKPFRNNYIEYIDSGIRLQIYCNQKSLVEIIRLVNDASIKKNSDWES